MVLIHEWMLVTVCIHVFPYADTLSLVQILGIELDLHYPLYNMLRVELGSLPCESYNSSRLGRGN